MAMTLRTFLNNFDFDYEINNGKIDLIDEQKVYLGGFETYQGFEIRQDVCYSIIERLDTFLSDYIYDDIIEEEFNGDDKFDGDYELLFLALLDKTELHISIYELSLVFYILYPEHLIIEEIKSKEVN